MLTRIELLEDQREQRQHQRDGVFPGRLQQFIEPIPAIGDAGAAKPIAAVRLPPASIASARTMAIRNPIRLSSIRLIVLARVAMPPQSGTLA
jgi:hypothetical protein